MASRLDYTNKQRSDDVDAPTQNNIGGQLDDLYDALDLEHDPSDGSHDTVKVARGVFYVSTSGGTPTLETSGGIVSSVSDNGVGDIVINLSSNLADDGSGNYEYIVEATIVGSAGAIYAGTLAAGSFHIQTTDMDGTAADVAFSGAVYGTRA